MQVIVSERAIRDSSALYEALLGNGNRKYLVSVHGGKLAKVTPIKTPIGGNGNACAGVAHPQGRVNDNSTALAQLLALPFAQYVVTVCYGMIAEIAPVEREQALTAENVRGDAVDAVDTPVKKQGRKAVEATG